MKITYSYNFPLLTDKNIKEDSEVDVLIKSGYLYQTSGGCFALLPLGKILINNITNILSEIAAEAGFMEVHFPFLQKQKLWERSGRFEQLKNSLASIKLNNGSYVLNATQEEILTNFIVDNNTRLKTTNIKLFQASERVRNEIRPSNGLIRSVSFFLCDFYVFCNDENNLIEKETLVSVYQRFFAELNLNYFIAEWRDNFDSISFCISNGKRYNQCEIYFCEQCNKYFRGQNSYKCNICNNDFIIMSGTEIGDIANTKQTFFQSLSTQTFPYSLLCGGIGLSKLLQILSVEFSDSKGLKLPKSVTPFDAYIISDMETFNIKKHFIESLFSKIYVDCRNVSLGKKLIDADLVGFPVRILLKNENDNVEVKFRETDEVKVIPIYELNTVLGNN